MSSRVNVDQRPTVLRVLSGGGLLYGLFQGGRDFTRGMGPLYHQAALTLERTTGSFDPSSYINQCLKSAVCYGSYVQAGLQNMSDMAFSIDLTLIIWGLGMFLYAVSWKPELGMLRATRMRSQQQLTLVPQQSCVAPSGQSSRV
jgi:hypothetical protein